MDCKNNGGSYHDVTRCFVDCRFEVFGGRCLVFFELKWCVWMRRLSFGGARVGSDSRARFTVSSFCIKTQTHQADVGELAAARAPAVPLRCTEVFQLYGPAIDQYMMEPCLTSSATPVQILLLCVTMSAEKGRENTDDNTLTQRVTVTGSKKFILRREAELSLQLHLVPSSTSCRCSSSGI